MTKKLSIVVAAIALASCDAGNGKNDIMGFMPGMKKADVHALAESHTWRCLNESKTDETCYTMSGAMRVAYATNMEGWPVSGLAFAFYTDQKVPLEIQAEDISKQFGKKPDGMTRDSNGDVEEVDWNLDVGNVLKLEMSNILVLENKSIVKADEDTGRQNAIQNARQSNPTPKF
jgi:hypothetical protein